MDSENYDIIEAMRKWGGGFVQRLAQCLYVADAENTRRLRLAFPEYWEQYKAMAQVEQERRASGEDA